MVGTGEWEGKGRVGSKPAGLVWGGWRGRTIFVKRQGLGREVGLAREPCSGLTLL